MPKLITAITKSGQPLMSSKVIILQLFRQSHLTGTYLTEFNMLGLIKKGYVSRIYNGPKKSYRIKKFDS